MPIAYALIAASAALLGTLGSIHLLYTYRGHKLDPRDPQLRAAMERDHPRITRETTVWRAAKGFNASHSLGLIAFALVYGYLALWRAPVLGGSGFLLGLGMAALLGWLALAQRYFFSIPLRGMALACVLYASGWATLA